jgi:ABC-2 type transport system ATP-binding protein
MKGVVGEQVYFGGREMKSILEVSELRKEFKVSGKRICAVDGISFELKPGEILGFLGPNGAGKTTTIQMLLTTLSQTSGDIRYFGKELYANRSEILQHVAFASSYTSLPGRLTVRENLDIYGRLYGLKKSLRKARTEKFLKHFGMWGNRDGLMGRLSAGQTTRVMLAKAFMAHPKVALLDEPTASLDPDIAHEVRAFVREQQKEHGVSILYTSHNMDEVSEVCDRVIFLKQGRIVAADTPERLALECSLTCMDLYVSSGIDALVTIAHEWSLEAERITEGMRVHVSHEQTGPFLSALGARGVNLYDVKIQRPTLEGYFLELAKEAA